MSFSYPSGPMLSPTDSLVESPSTILKRKQFPKISDSPLTDLVDVDRRYNLFSLSPDMTAPTTAIAMSPVQIMMLNRFLKDDVLKPKPVPRSIAPAPETSILDSEISAPTSKPATLVPQTSALASKPVPLVSKPVAVPSKPVTIPANPMSAFDFIRLTSRATPPILMNSSTSNQPREVKSLEAPKVEIRVNDEAVSLPGTPVVVKEIIETPTEAEPTIQANESQLAETVVESEKAKSDRTEVDIVKSQPSVPTSSTFNYQGANCSWRASGLPWFPAKPDLHPDLKVEPPNTSSDVKATSYPSPPPAPTCSSSFEKPLLRAPLPHLQTIFEPPMAPTSQRFPLEFAKSPLRSKPAPINPYLAPLKRSVTWDSADEPKTAITPKAPLASHFREPSIKTIREVRFSLPDDDFLMSPMVSPFADSIPDTPVSMISSNSNESLSSFSFASPVTPTQNHFVPIFSEPFEDELMTPVDEQLTPIEDDIMTPVAEEQYTPIAAMLASFDTGRGRSAAREHIIKRTARSLSPRGSPKEYEPEPPKRHGTLLAMATVPSSKFESYRSIHRQMTCMEIKANAPSIGKNVVLQSYLALS